MTTPEAHARQNIDAQLATCEWIVQDRPAMNLFAGCGVAVSANLKGAGRLRQAILKRAYEGRLVEQDPEEEPAGNLSQRFRSGQLEPETKSGNQLGISGL